MNRSIPLILLIIFSTANTAIPQEKVDWNERHAELCKYDSGYCEHLKNSDGSWVQPKKEVLKAIEVLKEEIIAAGKLYHVDPRAIAGAIMAENSLNCTISDNIQDFLVKYKLAPKGDVLGKKFTFGWAQLYMEAALKVEGLAAATEKRAIRDQNEIAEELLKPGSAIKYVAAVIKKIQNTYKDHGYDISSKPEILDTVYNLGKEEDKVAELVRTKRQPRPNYFGFFVWKNIDAVETSLGLTKTETVIAKVEPVTQKTAPTNVKTTTVKPVATALPKNTGPLVSTAVVTKDIMLVQSPPTCSKEGSGNFGDYNKVLTAKEYPQSGKLSKSESYEILSPGIDCDMNDWSLVRGSSGTIGWISNKVLNTVTSKEFRPKECARTPDKNCVDSLSSIPGNKPLGNSYYKLQSLGAPNSTVSWKQPSIGNSNFGSPSNSQQNIITSDELIELKKMILDKKDDIIKSLNDQAKQAGRKVDHAINVYDGGKWETKVEKIDFKIHHFTDDGNPYSRIFDNSLMNGLTSKSDKELKALSLHSYYFSKSDLINAINFRPKLEPSYSELKSAYMGFSKFYSYNFYKEDSNSKKDESSRLDQFKLNLLSSLSSCEKIGSDYKTSKPKIEAMIRGVKALKNTPTSCTDYSPDAEKISQYCRMMTQLNENSASYASFAKDCPSCISNYNYIYTQNGSFAMPRLSEALFNSLLSKPEERDDFLYDQINSLSCLNSLASYVTSTGNSVSYQPLMTAELIEKILKLNCVKTVYVPDPWLVMKFHDSPKKVIYRPFMEEDRFMVDTSESECK